MIIGLISDKENEKLLKNIQQMIATNKHHAIILNTSSEFINNCKNLANAIKSKKVDRGICIDNYGILAFMYLGKIKDVVVAEISDEHSAYMTCSHNNATVLSFGSLISTEHMIKCMVQSFLNSHYEGSRHKVRIDMLSTLLENE
jgi:galactose-6-phosphate isomerase